MTAHRFLAEPDWSTLSEDMLCVECDGWIGEVVVDAAGLYRRTEWYWNVGAWVQRGLRALCEGEG